MRILLIAGGWSNEREISLLGAESIFLALEELGHEVDLLDLSESFDQLLERASLCQLAFINLHGSPGEDGLVQAMLDSIGVPYQGSGPAGSFLALNKAAAKQIYRLNGLLTPNWRLFTAMPKQTPDLELTYPVFVKPNTAGSSVGMSMVKSRSELMPALQLAFAHDKTVLAEEAISGEELTCAVLGRETLPPILIKPAQGSFFDYRNKYTPGVSKEICPAPVPERIDLDIRQTSLTAHQVLGLHGCSRSDFIRDSQDRLYLLETNTLPGMTPMSLLPLAAQTAGLTYKQLVARLLDL